MEIQAHAAFRWVDAGAAGADWQVAFIGERWDAGEIVSSGVYVAPVAFDQNGTPVLTGAPALIAEDVIDYHFSPDGTLMVYEQMGALFILDLLSGNTSMLTVGGLEPTTPQFSPNGLQLPYQSRDRDAGVDGIHVADLGVEPVTGDFFIVGESRVASEHYRRKGAGGTYITSGPYWSPTGNYLAYGVENWAGFDVTWAAIRIAADGSNPTNLIPDDGGAPLLHARGWR
ncbi:MAG: hypothetical protein A2V98_12715 [Planctomycetes bacterium RBG_16_64_12]|nr:MAG: hypothetical protein A2V98_12715 [Planctomycetes bacterium RBG_16_64_12]